MKISQLQIQKFKNFFSGSQHNYGEFIYSEATGEGKRKGNPRTVTNKLITITEYKDHLEGTKGLGVIPITENSKCSFSAIDVDIYDKDLTMYVEAIERGGFPLVPFKSKSGGLHLYLFLKSEENTKKVLEVMRKFSFLLSIDNLVKSSSNRIVEVFPKQFKIKPGEFGSWINLPYYHAEKTTQYAIKKGNPLSLNDALVYIEEKQTTLEEITEFLNDLSFNDAPPCLQLAYFLNPLEKHSGRNNYLFSFGVYFKKKDEDFFEQNLKEVNNDLKEPLTEQEIERTIISSLRKRDYVYKCNESPCVDFCHKKECSKREYGIGKNEGYFSNVEFGKLFQYRIAQPYYEWEVRLQGQETFKKLRFKSEDEIIRQDAFLRLCMRELHELPSKLKQLEWFAKVNQALKEMEVISVDFDDDTSPLTMLRSLIVEFLTMRAMAETKDQILVKRVYYENGKGEYYFRVKDLTEYLYVQKQFRYFSPSELHGILRELNCSYTKIYTESKKQVRVAVFSKNDFKMYESGEGAANPDFSKYSEEDF